MNEIVSEAPGIEKEAGGITYNVVIDASGLWEMLFWGGIPSKHGIRVDAPLSLLLDQETTCEHFALVCEQKPPFARTKAERRYTHTGVLSLTSLIHPCTYLRHTLQ